MTIYLLYCILSSKEMGKIKEPILSAIDGEPVHELCSNTISGVISILNKVPGTDVKTLLAYHGVIESYHQRQTVLPMRFGAVFRQEAHMITALKNNEKSYLLQLKRLHGCTEMCIRFIATAPHENHVEEKEPSQKKISGTAFLQHRKAIYERQNRLPSEPHQKSKSVLRHLKGTYIEFKQERRLLGNVSTTVPLPGADKTNDNRLLISLFFLISKKNIALFRSRFQEIPAVSSAGAGYMINGPWPPFNFIDAESCFAINRNIGDL